MKKRTDNCEDLVVICNDCDWEGVPYSDPDLPLCKKCGWTNLRLKYPRHKNRRARKK